MRPGHNARGCSFLGYNNDMTYHFDGYNYVLRLEKGEEMIEVLNTFAHEQDLKSVWLSGLGGALSAELGYYNLETKTYEWHAVNELTEITALQGNLAWENDQPKWHIHATLGKRDLQAVGGHVKTLIVGGTCELFLHRIFDTTLTRRNNADIGLSLLDL